MISLKGRIPPALDFDWLSQAETDLEVAETAMNKNNLRRNKVYLALFRSQLFEIKGDAAGQRTQFLKAADYATRLMKNPTE
eukprot:m.132070 g.132070  ORF g.132070 m.132070 type:complete len:81 (+) comp9826_c0_seq3:619-861(+)